MLSNTFFILIFSTFAIASDPIRPQFHFMPEKNWMNDPNGPMQWNGLYHLFYQYNPYAAVWGNMHWGHAVSTDLVHWQHLPIALYEDKPYDIDGVFSGSITITDSGPIIIYTGVSSTEAQCIATPLDLSDPLLVNWTKSASNPVIPNPPSIYSVYGWRDPTTAWTTDGGVYNILTAAGLSGIGGAVLQYQTKDFISWDYVNPMMSENNPNSNSVWECPDFYPLSNDLYLLKYSDTTTRRDLWTVGTYDETSQTFTPTQKGVYDYGTGAYYASKTFQETSGQLRRILWGWVTENDAQPNWIARGWAGIQTLPRVVTLGSDGLPRFNPVPELEKIRGQMHSAENVKVSNSTGMIWGIYGGQLEIYAEVENYQQATRFGFNIAVAPNGSEITPVSFTPRTTFPNTNLIGFDFDSLTVSEASECQSACDLENFCSAWTFEQGNICWLKNDVPTQYVQNDTCTSGLKALVTVDRSHSSLNDPILSGRPNPTGPYNDTVSTLQVRIFVDHSAVEVYVNEGQNVMTTRIYPATPPDEWQFSFFAYGPEPVIFTNVTVWYMDSIWN